MKLSNADSRRFDVLGSGDVPAIPQLNAAAVRSWQKGVGYFSLFAGVATLLAANDTFAKATEKTAPQPVSQRALDMAKKLSGACSKPELLRRQSNYRLPSQKGEFNMFEVLTGTDNCPGTPIPSGTYTVAAPFVDTGNTTGANSTVDFVQPNCIEGPEAFYEQVVGFDHIYSFTLSARGATPQIRVTPGSGFDTSVYILSSTGTACPAGTNNDVLNCLTGTDLQLSNGSETINSLKMNTLPLGVQLFLFVDSFYSTPGAGGVIRQMGPYTLRVQDVTIGSPVTPPSNDAPVDINGDGKTDFVTIRNTGGGTSGQATWYTSFQDGFPTNPTDWGIASDQFVPADFDGDGKDDFAIFRPGTQGIFYIVRSATSTMFTEKFGISGDDASVVGDYTGDNRDDLAVYRAGATSGAQSSWYYRSIGSPPGVQKVEWGQNGDFPAPGDYDGDGRYDFVVQRPDFNGVHGRFWKRMASGEQSSEMFGLRNDAIVPGDYDGDGRTDLAVARDDNGFIRWDFEPSNTPGSTIVSDTWGVSATDFITQGDYDGDGRTDYSVWRPGSPGRFYIMTVGDRIITGRNWGQTGDIPAANYNEH